MDRRGQASARRDAARKRHYDIAAQELERKEREAVARENKQVYLAKFANERLMVFRENRAAARFAKRKQIMERAARALKVHKPRSSRH